MRNGLVYLNFRDTIYCKVGLEWKTTIYYQNDRPPRYNTYSSNLSTITTHEKDIPEDIKVYTMPDGGIDPYEFLNLKKPPANANE